MQALRGRALVRLSVSTLVSVGTSTEVIGHRTKVNRIIYRCLVQPSFAHDRYLAEVGHHIALYQSLWDDGLA